MSRVDELNDNCFALATEYLVSLSNEMEAESGRKPTLAEVCEVLAWGFRSCSADILKDTQPSNVLALKATVARARKVALVAGDLLAIPAPGHSFYRVVFITKNRFGFAYGPLRGLHNIKPPSLGFDAQQAGPPVYSGHRHVASGRWRTLGNYPALLALFPSEPEIYHRKVDGYNRENPDIGRFGSGEAPTGALRALSETEATELGLLDGTYQQGLLEDEVETLLGVIAVDHHAPPGAA